MLFVVVVVALFKPVVSMPISFIISTISTGPGALSTEAGNAVMFWSLILLTSLVKKGVVYSVKA